MHHNYLLATSLAMDPSCGGIVIRQCHHENNETNQALALPCILLSITPQWNQMDSLWYQLLWLGMSSSNPLPLYRPLFPVIVIQDV